MRRALALTLALALGGSGLCPALAAPASVELIELPERLTLPMAAGTNKLFAVRIEGKPTAVWMAIAADAPEARRLPLHPMGGRYVFNLGDPKVGPVVEGGRQFQVFAAFADGRSAESLPVQFVAAQPAWAKVKFIAPDGTEQEAGARWNDASWVDLARVARLSIEWGDTGVKKPVTLKAGDVTVVVDPGDAAERPLDGALRAAWVASGELAVYTDDGRSGQVFAAIPERLQLDAPASFTVSQRSQAAIPGSLDYLSLHLNDISGGKVELVIATYPRQEMARAVAHQGDVIPFTYRGGRYTLTLTRMVNMLIGDDYAEFTVQAAPEDAAKPAAKPAARPAAGPAK